MTTHFSTDPSSATPQGHFPRLHQAIKQAVIWHSGQDRKYTQLPYIVHPLRVMQIVRSVTDNEDMLIASVLHDVVEDTPVTLSMVEELFGHPVAQLVDWLTDVSRPEDGNRAARKNIDLEHSAAAPADAQTIKLADLLDNTRSIERSDPHFARIYMKEKERLLTVLVKGHPALLQEAHDTLRAYQEAQLQNALKPGS